MSIKLRLQRLEESQKAKADAVSQGVTAEQSRQTREWINATVENINERRRLINEGLLDENAPRPKPPPFPHFDLSNYSPQRLKAIENTRAWLNQILEQKQRSEHEQPKTPIA
jgi:hypothetical protein